MLPAIWIQCLWVLDILAVEGGSRGVRIGLEKRRQSFSPTSNLYGALTAQIFGALTDGVSNLVRQIFLSSNSHREVIVSSLLKHVFSSTALGSVGVASSGVYSSHRSSSRSSNFSRGSTTREYPPLGNAASTAKAAMSLNAASIERTCTFSIERVRADICSRVMVDLVSVYPDVGCQVFNAFLSHLNPDVEGTLALPPLKVLSRVIACMLAAIDRSPQIESTLLIIIQKYISAVTLSADRQSLMSILSLPQQVPLKLRVNCIYNLLLLILHEILSAAKHC
jgi:hypothetical protein